VRQLLGNLGPEIAHLLVGNNILVMQDLEFLVEIIEALVMIVELGIDSIESFIDGLKPGL
jgi:hypothetical protein